MLGASRERLGEWIWNKRGDGLAAFIEGSVCQDRSASLTCFNAFDFYVDLSVK